MITRRAMLGLMASAFVPGTARAAFSGSDFVNTRMGEAKLPPVADRLPKNPRVIDLAAMDRAPGLHGGDVRMLIGGQRDVRLMLINSYARLVGYDENLALVPDILEAYEIEQDRIFTFHLRAGHKWSDGSDFTSEDFRYCWEDVLMNRELHRGGPPVGLLVDKKPPRFEVLDAQTVRYSWDQPMPDFLSKLAAPVPQFMALPSHYARQFHAKYQSADVLARLITANRVDDWSSLHMKMTRQNRPENPDLPTLQGWMPVTAAPAEQFVFERNPYYHRVDENGRQLPYIDRMILNVSSPDILAAKTATGESDLQFVGLDFSDYTLLKSSEKTYPSKVLLWTQSQGSRLTLRPNLNYHDDVWRKVMQDARFRRALSSAIDRKEINKAVFYGLGQESADTVLPESPLFKPEYATAWVAYDPELANRLLDEVGLDKRGDDNIRLLPDGRPVRIVIESAGEGTLETDVLELIRDHFYRVGLSLFTRVSQRDIFRSRAIGGQIMMSIWQGLDNGVPTADMAPTELAPTADDQLQWPLWGLHYMSAFTQGKAPDMPEVEYLVTLLDEWRKTTTTEERTAIWGKMLAHHADQVFTIGTINRALQPLVRSSQLRNMPDKALFGYQPKSYLGAYLPDTFWYDRSN